MRTLGSRIEDLEREALLAELSEEYRADPALVAMLSRQSLGELKTVQECGAWLRSLTDEQFMEQCR
jgi:hypothetical protein